MIGPPFYPLTPKTILYDEADVENYVRERRVDPTVRAALEESLAHR
jgi:hypothetical protein